MFINASPVIVENVHNLVNLHLFPHYRQRLGEAQEYRFRNADIVLERVGNLYASDKNVVTYRYCIDGPDFEVSLLGIWGGDDATANVKIISLSDGDEAQDAFRQWLSLVVDARMPPRDMFEHMLI